MLEEFRRVGAVNDRRRRETGSTLYELWAKELLEAGKERFARDAVRDAILRLLSYERCQPICRKGLGRSCSGAWSECGNSAGGPYGSGPVTIA